MPQLRQLVIAARIPFAEFRIHDPEGNGIDISQKGWKV